MTRFAFILVLAACGSGGGNSTPQVDAASGPPCTGAIYDPCTSNDQCTSQQCHVYGTAGLQVCTQACSATVPCPNDTSGAAVTCNMMGNCKPAVANNCHR
jgi:hypothetical protein